MVVMPPNTAASSRQLRERKSRRAIGFLVVVAAVCFASLVFLVAGGANKGSALVHTPYGSETLLPHLAVVADAPTSPPLVAAHDGHAGKGKPSERRQRMCEYLIAPLSAASVAAEGGTKTTRRPAAEEGQRQHIAVSSPFAAVDSTGAVCRADALDESHCCAATTAAASDDASLTTTSSGDGDGPTATTAAAAMTSRRCVACTTAADTGTGTNAACCTELHQCVACCLDPAFAAARRDGMQLRLRAPAAADHGDGDTKRRRQRHRQQHLHVGGGGGGGGETPAAVPPLVSAAEQAVFRLMLAGIVRDFRSIPAAAAEGAQQKANEAIDVSSPAAAAELVGRSFDKQDADGEDTAAAAAAGGAGGVAAEAANFRYCVARCRHSGASTFHQNRYASTAHHCFDSTAPAPQL